MGAPDILATLNGAGLSLTLAGADAVKLAPRERITPELRALVITHKRALLVALRKSAPPAASPDASPAQADEAPQQPSSDVADDDQRTFAAVALPASPRRPARSYWRISDGDGARVVLLSPPATAGEVQACYPGADVREADAPPPHDHCADCWHVLFRGFGSPQACRRHPRLPADRGLNCDDWARAPYR